MNDDRPGGRGNARGPAATAATRSDSASSQLVTRGQAPLRQHRPPDGRPDHRLGRLRSVRARSIASRRWSSRPARAPLVLDSATALFSPRPPPEALRSHFFQLVHTLRDASGLTSVILAEAPGDYGPLTTLGVEDYVCDLTLDPAQHHRRRPPPALDRGQQVPPQRALQGRVPLHRHDARASRSSRSTPRSSPSRPRSSATRAASPASTR